jgi:hypothetical protein
VSIAIVSGMSISNEPNAANPYASPVEAVSPQITTEGLPRDGEIRELFERGKNGAAWFYWVAGLSLINTLCALTESNFGFALGLNVTLIADYMALDAVRGGAEDSVKLLALGFDLVVYALMAACGWLSQKRVLPVFAIGMALYLLDALLFFVVFDVVSTVLHAFALWSMWSGFSAYRRLNALEQRMLMAGAVGGV